MVELPDDLVRRLIPLRDLIHRARNTVFPVVGSGLSLGPPGQPEKGLMGWRGFLEQLIEKARAEDQAELRDLLQQRRFLEMASLLEYDIGIGPGGLAQHIQREFARPKKPAPEVYKLVAALPTDHFATTNYDPWLKNAVAAQVSGAPRVYVPGDHGAFTDIAPSSPPLVLMLHGDADRPVTCVLSQRAYRRTQYLPTFRRGMEALAAQRTFLFVGHSLSDPDLVTVLEEWAEVFSPGGGGVPRHVLLGAGLDRATVLRLHELAVEPIEYGKGNDHSALPAVLRFLATPPDGPATSGAVGSGSSSAKGHVGGGGTRGAEKLPAEGSQGPSATPGDSLAAPAERPLRPRILFAGPWFGVRKELQKELAKLGATSGETLSEAVRGKLEIDAAVARAQLAAILRYDLIVDLSPWRAFERWMSVGFRDVEQVLIPTFSAMAPDCIGVFAFGPEGAPEVRAVVSTATLPATQSKSLIAATAARLTALQTGLPGFVDRLLRDAGDGIALAGFSEDNVAVTRPWLERMTGAAHQVLLTTTPPSWLASLGFKAMRSSAPLDPALDSATVADYLRALRVVAGQVKLLGEVKYRPLEDVFVELELHREPAPRAPGRGAADASRASATQAATSAKPASSDSALEPGAQAQREEQRDREESRLREEEDFDSSALAAERRLTAEGLLSAVPRLYLEGLAGTGKSTLLRWLTVLASRAAERGGPLPLWVELANLQNAPGSLTDALTAGALQATRLLAHSPATDELHARLHQGEALLLLDGLDEASTSTHNALATRLDAELPPSCRLVLSSRPLLDRRAQLERLPRVRLHGLAPGGTVRFVTAYFNAPPWQSKLLSGLDMLPDGERWRRTPVLLALAATHIAAGRELPEHTLELYEQSIVRLLALGAPRAGAASSDYILRSARLRLQQAARGALLPKEGTPTTSLPRSALGAPPERDIAAQSGLFSGGDVLRFSHLTLGEYLAAMDLVQRAGAPDEILTALEAARRNSALLSDAREALAIAHALAGEAALLAALGEAEDAVEADPSHALLGLVLRALIYGGEGAQRFVQQQGGRVVSAVAAVFQLASGRFGEAEQRIGALAERAVRGMQRWWPDDTWHPLAMWQGRTGALGLEAHVLAWWLGATWPLPVGLSRSVGRGDEARIWAGLSQRDAAVPLARRLEQLWEGSDDVRVRAAAISALATQPSALDALGGLDFFSPFLRDRDVNVRVATISALAHHPNALDLLSPFLEDPISYVRAATISALAHHPNALDLLSPLLQDSHRDVRAAAVSALAANPDALDLLSPLLQDSHRDVRAAAVSALAAHPSALDLLSPLLQDSDGDVRAAAISALAAHPSALSLLSPFLQDSDNDVRAAAVSALATHPNALSLLSPFLQDHNGVVRAAAVFSLASHPTQLSLITPFLKAPDNDILAAAVSALATHPNALSLLAPLIKGPDEDVRAAAISALATHPKALDLFAPLIKGPDEDVRAAAISALATHPNALDLLAPLLQDPNQGVRAAAISALATHPNALSLLAPFLNDSAGSVRAVAISSLATHPNALDLLAPLLSDPAWIVRAAAASALALQPNARDLIAPLLQAPEWIVRHAAVTALAHRPNSLDLISPLLQDLSRHVRAAAVSALAQQPNALNLLSPALKDPDNVVRATAARAYRVHHPNALDLISPLLRDPDINVRAIAAAGLRSRPRHTVLSAAALRDRSELDLSLSPHFGAVPSWARTLASESFPSFARSPRPLHLDEDPALSQQVLSWVLRRMTAHATTTDSSELTSSPGHLYFEDLGDRGQVLWVHVQMEPYELARQRNVPTSANVLRAYEQARFLITRRPTWVILACVDVAPEDVRPLISPFVDQLATPSIANRRHPPLLLNPPFYGFALAHGDAPSEAPAPAALFAADLQRRWSVFTETEREEVLSFLSRQARSATVEPWMLVAPLAALGQYLPPRLAEVLRARLPTGVGRAADLLDIARSAAGTEALLPPAELVEFSISADSSPSRSASTSVSVRLQLLADQLIAADVSERPDPLLAADQIDKLASHLPSLDAGDVLRLLAALDTFWAQTGGDARSQLARRLLSALEGLPFTDPKVLRRRSGLLSPLRRYLHEQG